MGRLCLRYCKLEAIRHCSNPGQSPESMHYQAEPGNEKKHLELRYWDALSKQGLTGKCVTLSGRGHGPASRGMPLPIG